MKAVFCVERKEDGSFKGEPCWECGSVEKIMVEIDDGNVFCKGCLLKAVKIIDDAYQDHSKDPRQG